jgi:tetratricopeptide (TPR) repeat protein
MRIWNCLRVVAAVLVVAGILGGGAGLAQAQDESLNRARDAFEKAQTLFEAGSYAEAAAKFEEAYQARPFAQFLFNIGASFEKMAEYDKAVDHYRRYLRADPQAQDRAKTERRIVALEKAAAEVRARPAAPPDGGAAPPPSAVAGLEEVAPRGLVVIESEPQGANIYLDSKRSKPLSKTPWNGSLEGEHLVLLEREGYKPVERRISPDPSRLIILYFGMAEEDYLGWVEITSNVPGAAIYIDDKAAGVYQRAPYQGNLPPGPHKIWVTAEGYDEIYREVNIVAGQTHKVEAQLKGSPVGYLDVRGRGVDKVKIVMDGEVLCERGPCRAPVPEGRHQISVRREGFKDYTTVVDMQAKTEVTLRARLAPKPSRADAVVMYLVSAALIGGGVWAGLQAKNLEDELRQDIATGMPPPDSDDPRFLRGKIYSIGADAAFALGGVSLLTAVYYTFRDKGAASTGATEVKVLTTERRKRAKRHARRARFQPVVTPGYAGAGMEVSW